MSFLVDRIDDGAVVADAGTASAIDSFFSMSGLVGIAAVRWHYQKTDCFWCPAISSFAAMNDGRAITLWQCWTGGPGVFHQRDSWPDVVRTRLAPWTWRSLPPPVPTIASRLYSLRPRGRS